MRRFILFLLLHYLLWFLIKNVCGEVLNSTAIYDCNCDVQIDVVKTLIQKLEAVQKREDDILAQISRIETKLQSVDEQESVRQSVPSSCLEASAESFKRGVYNITLKKFSVTPIAVYCIDGWLVIQRRVSSSVDFYRDWRGYKNGFGVLDGNFWIGLEKLHAFTSSCQHELRIEMSYKGVPYYARYSEFVVGSESEGYPLKVLGTYEGDAGDSLRIHEGMKFSTYDNDNDIYGGNCAYWYKGGWWYENCYESNLNGRHLETWVVWKSISMNEALKSVQMMIRPTEECLRHMSMKAK